MSPRLILLKLVLEELGIDPAKATVMDVQRAIYICQMAGLDLGYHFMWL